MSEDVNVRTVTTRREMDGLFELAAGFVGGAARIGLTVASAPLVLLPRNSRRRVRRAMAELARAVVAFPRELAAVSERVVDDIYANGGPTNVNLPSVGEVRDRARAFTDRLSKAADEFGASVSRATSQAADATERAAARVDEWVEKQ
jgi:hypothetical protein